MNFTIQQIAEYVHGSIEGDGGVSVSSFAKIEEAKEGDITFLANPKYTHYLYQTEATAVLINRDLVLDKPVNTTLIRVENAYDTLAKLLQMYQSMQPRPKGIDPLAFIASTARVADDVYVGAFAYIGEGAKVAGGSIIHPHAYIGRGVKVGEGCIIYPHATVYHDCVIGNSVTLHSGCVVGADGFGFAPNGEGYDKIPQIGIVKIEDDVEIGANACIDRATMGATLVRRGVKIDNLVQIAHNVEVGANTVMAAQSGLAGSTKLGEHCMVGGQVGVAGHLQMASRTTIGAQAGVTGAVKQEGMTILGAPAIDAKAYMKSYAVYRKLPELYAMINQLNKEVEQLREQQQRT